MVDESLMKLSNWYKRTGQIFLEREVQEELLERQTNRATDQIKPLIETYKNISFSHRREGVDIYQSLSPLKKALEKINLPEFGVCVRCSESIAQGRIVLMPESTLCVSCAEKR